MLRRLMLKMSVVFYVLFWPDQHPATVSTVRIWNPIRIAIRFYPSAYVHVLYMDLTCTSKCSKLYVQRDKLADKQTQN